MYIIVYTPVIVYTYENIRIVMMGWMAIRHIIHIF